MARQIKQLMHLLDVRSLIFRFPNFHNCTVPNQNLLPTADPHNSPTITRQNYHKFYITHIFRGIISVPNDIITNQIPLSVRNSWSCPDPILYKIDFKIFEFLSRS